jgi:hypothetical protein
MPNAMMSGSDLPTLNVAISGHAPPHHRLAVYKIVSEVESAVITSDGGVMQTGAYSRFKYGDRAQARRYADQLTGVILKSPMGPTLRSGDPVVVTASAYKKLRTAAQFVADGVAHGLQRNGCNVVPGRIHRANLTQGDYGAMNAEERAWWMAKNGLSLDESLFSGAHVVVVDDVCITGSHERSIAELLRTVPVRSVTNAYVADIDPLLAARDTRIEHRMNHAWMNGLANLRWLMRNQPDYVLTARTVKFILDRPASSLKRFLTTLRQYEICLLRQAVLDDGYHRMPMYTNSVRTLFRAAYRPSASRAVRRVVWLASDTGH